MSVLEINGLTVDYRTEEGTIRAVDGVSFELNEGEILGIVGESGCGKTTVAKSIQGLLPENGSISEGAVKLQDETISTLNEKEYNEIRWKEIAYIAQSAMSSLDPVYRINAQFREIYKVHTDLSKAEMKERTKELLQNVGLDPARGQDYPHELSGGQRQRVVIALALALDPALLIADEPTTGLDVVVQAEILDLIKDIQEVTGSSMLFITHDISVVAEIADRVAVMYGGHVVEIGPTNQVFNNSAHPYTMGLHNAFPSFERDAEEELISIPGSPPENRTPPSGCQFEDRCPFATEECSTDPPYYEIQEHHLSKCHYANEADELREEAKESSVWQTTASADGD